MDSSNYELIIAGAGPAGLSAALWANELGIGHLVLEENSEPGGQLLSTFNRIENHLGVKAQNGRELRDVFVKQLEKCRAEFRYSAKIESIDPKNNQVKLADGVKFTFGSLLLCTGVRRRALGIPGETDFRGKGVITSGKKEAAYAAGKEAVVVGGGDAAFENALILAEHAKKTTLIHRRSSYSARKEFVSAVHQNPQISLVHDSMVVSFNGSNLVESVTIKGPDGVVDIPAGVVVVRIGVVPNSELVRGKIELDKKGYVLTNDEGRTSNTLIYAAGDIANPVSPTISTAVGSAATSVKSIYEMLRKP